MPFTTASALHTLNTDFYQLTMAAGYHQHCAEKVTSFELYLRKMPAHRHFLIVAGLEHALDYLKALHFSSEAVSYLEHHPALCHLPASFFEALSKLRFTGDVDALPEGTLCFEHTPILRVSAPVMQAQLVETFLLALINYQTNVASKAARIYNVLQKHTSAITQSAPTFIDFGSRRAQGPEAALHAARAAYIGGAVATSNVAAGFLYQLPITGTAAHAWTMAFATEQEAFRHYADTYPEHTVLLVDTYDTLQGIRNAIATAGKQLKAIRLDSGDFLSLSKTARHLLDEAGLTHTQIMVSGDMNEYRIHELLTAGAPIDSFGVGTELTTCKDTPSLGGVYKLVESISPGEQHPHYAIKSSAAKVSYPGKKQVWRYTHQGKISHDRVSLEGPEAPTNPQTFDSVTPLLQPYLRGGKDCQPSRALADIRLHALSQLQQLPEGLKDLEPTHAYPVYIHQDLQDLYNTCKKGVAHEKI